MLSLKKYSQSNKLQESAFVQLKNPETGEFEFTESGEPIGVELYAIQSKEFKRAMRSTAHLGLTKAERKRKQQIEEAMNDNRAPSVEDLDFLDSCEDKVASQLQMSFAMVTKRLKNMSLSKKDAKDAGILINEDSTIVETVENIHALYRAAPDLSEQISKAVIEKENFIKS